MNQQTSTQQKKAALDKFDDHFLSENSDENARVLNRVGKVNVGWNTNYLGTLPNCDVLVDAGAADDFFALHDAHPEAYSILIDANKKYRDTYENYLATKEGKYHICALGQTTGEVDFFYYPERPYLSSVLQRQDIENFQCETSKIKMKTLDQLVSLRPGQTAMIKLDVEGVELSILKGAPTLLTQTHTVICECSLDSRFPGGEAFSKIFSFLSNEGFKLADIIRVPRNDYNAFPALVIDAVFLRVK